MAVHKDMDLSGLSLRQLRDRRRRIARQIPDLEVLIAGSLQIQRRRYGKEGRRCARGSCIEENFAIFDFELTPEELHRLDTLGV